MTFLPVALARNRKLSSIVPSVTSHSRSPKSCKILSASLSAKLPRSVSYINKLNTPLNTNTIASAPPTTYATTRPRESCTTLFPLLASLCTGFSNACSTQYAARYPATHAANALATIGNTPFGSICELGERGVATAKIAATLNVIWKIHCSQPLVSLKHRPLAASATINGTVAKSATRNQFFTNKSLPSSTSVLIVSKNPLVPASENHTNATIPATTNSTSGATQLRENCRGIITNAKITNGTRSANMTESTPPKPHITPATIGSATAPLNPCASIARHPTSTRPHAITHANSNIRGSMCDAPAITAGVIKNTTAAVNPAARPITGPNDGAPSPGSTVRAFTKLAPTRYSPTTATTPLTTAIAFPFPNSPAKKAISGYGVDFTTSSPFQTAIKCALSPGYANDAFVSE